MKNYLSNLFSKAILIAFMIAFVSIFMVSANSKPQPSIETFESGYASYYCGKFLGRKTANGEIFTATEYTCAHKTLPFGTLIKVTNTSNGEAIIVKVNDRGPFIKGRIIDLSLQGAKDLKILNSGIAHVDIEIVNQEYSQVGNVRNMERVAIEGSYAYVQHSNQTLIDFLYAKVFEKSNTESLTAKQTHDTPLSAPILN